MHQRDIKMDIFKGLLVVGMVYCHILQFFVNLGENSLAEQITWYINAITFSGFVFSFGYTSYIAYFSKTFQSSYKKMLFIFIKLLVAFYISGISFRVFVERKQFSWVLVKEILVLNDIPGWSEFIISFALYILMALILFKPLKKLIEHKKIFWLVLLMVLLTTFIPYNQVNNTQLGLIIGTTRYAAFPILQYMPFYLLGLYFKRYNIRINKFAVIVASLLTGTGITYMALNEWQLPGRFPPSFMWIILPVFPLYVYYIIGNLFETYKVNIKLLLIIGRNTMVYLLLSNILIFALSGVRGIKMLNTVTGFIANVFILGVITYLIQLSKPLKS